MSNDLFTKVASLKEMAVVCALNNKSGLKYD